MNPLKKCTAKLTATLPKQSSPPSKWGHIRWRCNLVVVADDVPEDQQGSTAVTQGDAVMEVAASSRNPVPMPFTASHKLNKASLQAAFTRSHS